MLAKKEANLSPIPVGDWLLLSVRHCYASFQKLLVCAFALPHLLDVTKLATTKKVALLDLDSFARGSRRSLSDMGDRCGNALALVLPLEW